jgi:hypothetical protein
MYYYTSYHCDPLILTPTVTTSPSCVDGDGVIAVATGGQEIMNIESTVAYTQWLHHLPVLLQEHIPFMC